ncbi:MAG: hypothetical protein ACXVRP_05540 [Solirubrobacteraceae bacterium]
MTIAAFRCGWVGLLVGALAGCSVAPRSSAAQSVAESAAGERARATEAGAAVFTWNDALNVFPASLSYTPGHEYDANFCELFVNGFGQGNSSNDGATVNWLEAYLSVPAQQGKLLNVAMYTRAAHGDVVTLAVPLAPDYWRTGFTTYRNAPGMSGGPDDDPVVDFAFFVDVQRPNGDVVDNGVDVREGREVVAEVAVERRMVADPAACDLVGRLRVVGPQRPQASLVFGVEQAEQFSRSRSRGKVRRHLGILPTNPRGGLASGSARSRRPECGPRVEAPVSGGDSLIGGNGLPFW